MKHMVTTASSEWLWLYVMKGAVCFLVEILEPNALQRHLQLLLNVRIFLIAEIASNTSSAPTV